MSWQVVALVGVVWWPIIWGAVELNRHGKP